MTAVVAHATRPRAASLVEARRDFDEFYGMTFAGLHAQIYAYLGNAEVARDLVHEALCRALAKWKAVQRKENPVAWVRDLAWALALKDKKSRRENNPAVLVRALGQIQPRLRQVLVMYHIGQISLSEIALQQDVSEETVSGWLSRGSSELSQHLAQKGA